MNGATGVGGGDWRLKICLEGTAGDLPAPSPFSLSLRLAVSPRARAHTNTLSWSLLGIVMATVQRNYQNTFMLTVVPDQELILSEAEAGGWMLKPRALCGGPTVGRGRSRRGGWGQAAGPLGRGLGTCSSPPLMPNSHLYSISAHLDSHTHTRRQVVAEPNTPRIQMDPNSNIWNNHDLIQHLKA